MSDNFPATPGSGRNVATDQVTYSGDLADVQLFRLVDVTGAEGSKTVTTPSFAVTGTFWQATQPVSGTVTANAGSGTFAISAASLPLPTGASTAAKQPALGTAGTASTDVLTVQGIASMTALKVDGSAVTQPVQAGVTVRVSANFTRPADTTAYALGDTVANSTTAGSVTPLTFSNVVRTAGGGGMVRRAKLRTSSVSITNAQFRLHLFAASQTSAAGDNAALSLPGAADYLGAIDITVDQAFTDGAVGNGTPRVGGEINLDIPSTGTTIYGFLEARAAYTPTSAEVFTVELEILQD